MFSKKELVCSNNIFGVWISEKNVSLLNTVYNKILNKQNFYFIRFSTLTCTWKRFITIYHFFLMRRPYQPDIRLHFYFILPHRSLLVNNVSMSADYLHTNMNLSQICLSQSTVNVFNQLFAETLGWINWIGPRNKQNKNKNSPT